MTIRIEKETKIKNGNKTDTNYYKIRDFDEDIVYYLNRYMERKKIKEAKYGYAGGFH